MTLEWCHDGRDIEMNRHGNNYWFNSNIWKMNWFYDRFNTHKWIDFSGVDYLSDNDEVWMIFFGAIRSPKVSSQTWIFFCFLDMVNMFIGKIYKRSETLSKKRRNISCYVEFSINFVFSSFIQFVLNSVSQPGFWGT